MDIIESEKNNIKLCIPFIYSIDTHTYYSMLYIDLLF